MRFWKVMTVACTVGVTTLTACGSGISRMPADSAGAVTVNESEYESGEDAGEGGADYRSLVDEHAKLYLALDDDGYLFETVLEAVEAYLGGSSDQEAAMRVLEDTRAEMEARLESVEKWEPDDEERAALKTYGIILEEYESFANTRGSQIQDYLNSLEALSVSLAHAEEYDFEYEEVEFWHELQRKIFDAYRAYYYYGCLNYWFAGWDEEKVTYIEDTVLDRTRAYIPEKAVWQSDRKAAEEMVMRYLDDVENILTMQYEHVAKQQEELYEMRKKAAEGQGENIEITGE